jgi:PAS domain S-box-containing protein
MSSESTAQTSDSTLVLEVGQLTKELQQAKFELQSSQARYRDLFELAPIGYFTIGSTGFIQQVNRAASRLLDIDSTDLIRQSVADFILEEDRPAFNSLLEKLFESKQPLSCELRMLKNTGASIEVSMSASTILDADEESVVCLALSDITAQKLNRSALEKSEVFKQTILNSIVDEIVVLDGEGTIVAVNRAWLQYGMNNGLEAGSAMSGIEVGANYLNVSVSEGHACLSSNGTALDMGLGIRAVMEGSLPSFEAEYPCHSPHEQQWFRITVTPMETAARGGVVIVHNDITQRMRLEIQQRETQMRIQKIASLLPGMVFQFRQRPDGSSCFPYASEIFLDIYRFNPEEALEDASKMLALIHPDDLDRVAESIQRSAQELTPWADEYRVKFNDGSVRWLSGHSLPQREPDGGTLWHGYVSDITAQKQGEEERLKTGALQSAIFNSANFSSIATDAKGVIQIFNVGAERMLGYMASEVLNKITPADISDPQELIVRAIKLSTELGVVITPGFEALVFKAKRGIEDIYELTYVRKDGSRLPAVVSVTALRDDQDAIIGYLLIGTDNTARQEVEEERAKLDQRLRDQQFYTRSLIESNTDAIMTTDPAGIISDVNKQMELLTGCTRDELIGAPFKDHFTNPEMAEASIDLVLREKTVANYELTARSRDGKETVVSFSASTFYDRNRKLQGVFAAARDVTERKRLDNVLQEKNIELESARATSEKANRAKTDFLANMSHEIRSPLNAILGLSYLLEKANLDLDGRGMVNKIRASGRMLLGLISGILDVSKIEAGQMVIEHEPFRLSEVMDNLSTALGVAVGDKNIELIVAPPPRGVSIILGDALRLEQVLINLCSNAIKFTESGRVEVRVEVCSSETANAMLRFCVLDTGIGIAPELQSQVFAAFTQADSSTTRRFGGTGLGLTICRQLVDLMGGEIGINSTRGEGSEFWFTLPLQEARDVDALALNAVGSLEALIAVVGAPGMRAVEAIAQGLGWQVTALDSGEAVLAHLSKCGGTKLPDIVVLDWKLPGMDGLATTRVIRESVPQSACAIVIATTMSLSSLAAQPGVELVDAILHRPFTPRELHNVAMQAQRRRAAAVGVLPIAPPGHLEGLMGIRILIVDDSEINLDVARRILASQGALVSAAINGQEAIDWLLLHANEVDLVLMDVQMPVMDGMEATRRLRRLPQFDDLPIVALTAGAFKSQHSAAKAAGMTHIVSKPFDVPLTVALIRRLRRPSKRSAATPALVMDAAQGLAIWQDALTYQTYLRRFAASYCDTVALLRTHLASGDRTGATALAHKLSGVAANLALPATRRAAQEAERLLGTQDDAEAALAELSKALVAVLAEINRYAPPLEVAKEDPDAAEPAAPALSAAAQSTLKIQLTRFLLALDSDNPVRIKSEMAALEQQLPAPALAALWLNVLGYDFRSAEARTRQLAIDCQIDLGD